MKKLIIISVIVLILIAIVIATDIDDFYSKLIQHKEFEDVNKEDITQEIITDIPVSWNKIDEEFPFGLNILSYNVNLTHLYLEMNASIDDYPNQTCSKPSQGYVWLTNDFYDYFEAIEYAEWNNKNDTAQFIKTTSKTYEYKPTYVKDCYENTLFKLRLRRNMTNPLPNKFFIKWGTSSTEYEIIISEGLRYAVYEFGNYSIKEISWKHQKELY